MRLKFREWIRLEDVKKKIDTEAQEGNWQKIPNLIFEFIILCGAEVDDPPWMEVQRLYNESVVENLPTVNLPLFHSKEKGKEKPWDYEGRSWYFWLNTFAKSYGWTPEIVAELDVDDAIALYQEILVDTQMQQEWEWGLSEVAYPYNKTTKKQHFKALGRPDWMSQYSSLPSQKVKTIKIPIKALPVGVVISLDNT